MGRAISSSVAPHRRIHGRTKAAQPAIAAVGTATRIPARLSVQRALMSPRYRRRGPAARPARPAPSRRPRSVAPSASDRTLLRRTRPGIPPPGRFVRTVPSLSAGALPARAVPPFKPASLQARRNSRRAVREEHPLSSTSKSFADSNLSREALGALRRAGFEHPTPIQAQAIPPALAGRDVIGTAATGTGKTAAFLLPILDRLAGEDRDAGARARADA